MATRPTVDEVREKSIALWRDANGKPLPSSVIDHLPDVAKQTRRAVVYMRVSHRRQRRQGNLRHRRRLLKTTLKSLGVKWIGTFSEVAPGTSLDGRGILADAIAFARENQAIVVTDTRDRFVRGPRYNGTAESDAPTPEQLRQLKGMARGVTLATLIDPDAPFEAVRSYQTKVPGALGDQAGRRAGRPQKTERQRTLGQKKAKRLDLWPQAKRLRSEGKGIREIGRVLGVSASTASDWFRRPGI